MGRYDLHATTDPQLTIGAVPVYSSHAELIAAAKALVKCPLPFRQLVHVSDQADARELTQAEEVILDLVLERAGLEQFEVEGD